MYRSKQHYIHYGVYTIGNRAQCGEKDGLTPERVGRESHSRLRIPHSHTVHATAYRLYSVYRYIASPREKSVLRAAIDVSHQNTILNNGY